MMNQETPANSQNVDEMTARVAELNRMYIAIRKEREDMEDQIAVAVSVHQVGQRVIQLDGDCFEITQIRRGLVVGTAIYFGRKILRSGALGKRELALYSPLTQITPDGEATQEMRESV